MTATINVRNLAANPSNDELERAIEVVGESFKGAPMDNAIVGYDETLRRPAVLSQLLGTLSNGGGEVLVAGAEEGAIDAVAIFYGPGQWADRTEEQRSFKATLFISKLSEKAKKWQAEELGPTMKALNERCFGENAKERMNASYYLSTLSTHPDKQKRGLGSALAKTIMKRADEAGVEVMVKTYSQENVDFYKSLGFVAASEPVTLSFEGGSTPYWFLTYNAK